VDRGASIYTQRNYRQALTEFFRWFQSERDAPPRWGSLQRDDFRSFLRFLGRDQLSRSAVRLRFSALRSFYRFLIRRGRVEASPIRNLALPQPERRLPKFLTAQQMTDLLTAPLKELEARRASVEAELEETPFLRDVAVLETIYSCGLRISELCGLRGEDIDWAGHLVRVRGKGKKERLVPIGGPALVAIRNYWNRLPRPPTLDAPVFLAGPKKPAPLFVSTRVSGAYGGLAGSVTGSRGGLPVGRRGDGWGWHRGPHRARPMPARGAGDFGHYLLVVAHLSGWPRGWRSRLAPRECPRRGHVDTEVSRS
jgi:site-specific recombinase XerD